MFKICKYIFKSAINTDQVSKSCCFECRTLGPSKLQDFTNWETKVSSYHDLPDGQAVTEVVPAVSMLRLMRRYHMPVVDLLKVGRSPAGLGLLGIVLGRFERILGLILQDKLMLPNSSIFDRCCTELFHLETFCPAGPLGNKSVRCFQNCDRFFPSPEESGVRNTDVTQGVCRLQFWLFRLCSGFSGKKI